MFQEKGKLLFVCVCVCVVVVVVVVGRMYVSMYVPPLIVHPYKRVMKLGGRIMPLEITL